jgi:filamentous hemagglutinin family protein
MASRRVKQQSRTKSPARLLAFGCLLSALLPHLSPEPAFAAPPLAQLPTGGMVASGQARIASSDASMTISQSTPKAIINWSSFDVGSQAHVTFKQPDASSQTLNRVAGAAASQIYGKITANGQVFLINPNGVVIGKNAQISASGIVVSTLDMTDKDFDNGNYKFQQTGPSGSIVNQGNLSTPETGYVTVLGVNVSNQGTINTGKAILASGNKIEIPVTESGLITLEAEVETATVVNEGTIKASDIRMLSTGAVTAKANSVIDASSATGRGGTVRLSGKKIEIKDNAKIVVNGKTGGGTIVLGDKTKTITTEVANNSRVEANATATGDGGNVIIWSTARTTIAGAIFAQGGSQSGNGGFVETSSSGSVKIIDSATINTLAPLGQTGAWLLDPEYYTIAASGGDETGASVTSSLATANRTISADNTIYVNDAINWSANTLTLTAGVNIDINAIMTATGTARLVLNTTSGVVRVGLTGNGFTGKVNLASGTSLSINSHAYTIINSLGAEGSTTATDLQGINGNLSGYYALGSDIDASATAMWNYDGTEEYYNGFIPIGDATNRFAGVLNGLGHTITSLYVKRPSTSNVALIGYNYLSAKVYNVGLLDADVTGFTSAGSLVGYNRGVVSHSFATGSVRGNDINVGGLVGYTGNTIYGSWAGVTVYGVGPYVGGLTGANFGTVTDSHATGSVGAQGVYVGGLIGQNTGTLTRGYATGNVSTTNSDVGGLVGRNYNGTINNSYSTGSVSSTSDSRIGGLVGRNYTDGIITNSFSLGAVVTAGAGLIGYNTGQVTNCYWDTTTSGKTSSSGGTGLTTAQMLTQANFSDWDFASIWSIAEGATYPYLQWQGTPNIIRASGTLSGGQTIRAAVNGVLMGSGAIGADGSVYIILPEGSFSGGDSLLLYNVGGGETAANAVYVAGSAIASGLSLNGSTLWASSGNGALSTTALVTAKGSLDSADIRYTVSGTDIALLSNTTLSNGSTIALDNALSWSANTLTINAGSATIDVNAILSATGTAALSMTTTGSIDFGLTESGFAGRIDLASSTALTINGNAYTIINSLGAQGSTTGTDLQGMQGNLNRLYALGSNIDATATSGWNSGAGFAPVSTYNGTFDGLGHLVSNLSINRPATDNIALFGFTNSSAVMRNVGIVNATISGNSYVGALAGRSYGSVYTSYSSGNVTGTTDYTGGLIGDLYASYTSVSGSFSSATVAGTRYVGGLVGLSSGSIINGFATGSVSGTSNIGGLSGSSSGSGISNSYATGHITGTEYVGGLVGRNWSQIIDSYATGLVEATGWSVGGLAGTTGDDSQISNSYATGNVSSTTGNQVGGLVGYAYYSTISSSYASGSASGAGDVGGFVGYAVSETITSSYAEGVVTASSTSSGGFIGRAITNSSIDTCYATGDVHGQSSVGGLIGSFKGTLTNSYASNDTHGGATSGNAYMGGLVGYNYGTITSSWSEGTSTSTGLYTGGLAGYNEGTIETSHSSVVVDSTSSYVGGLVGRNIKDISESYATGAVFGDGNYVGGFVGENTSAGTISTSNASGDVDGALNLVGGFVGFNNGIISDSHAVGNVTAGKNYSGYSDAGGFVGQNAGGSITGSYADGSVSGTGTRVGGFVGYHYHGTIETSHATGGVAATSRAGGFVGVNESLIEESYATGTLNATAGTVGGFAGSNTSAGVIDNSYATGEVHGAAGYVGGFVGSADGTIQYSHATGEVTSTASDAGGFAGGLSYGLILSSYASGNVSGLGDIGGLVGYTYLNGRITNSYATGTVSGTTTVGGLVGRHTGGSSINTSYATGNVIATVNFAGGLAALNSEASIANSYATGNVSSPNYTGGLVGRNTATGSITNSYSTGTATGIGLNGGLVADNLGSVTNSFWDTTTSGLIVSEAGTGLATADMKSFATYSSLWSISQSGTTTPSGSTIWVIYDDQTYPLIKTFMTSLTITADNALKAYDSIAFAGAPSATYAPTSYNTDAILGSLSYTGTYSSAANAGSYTIIPTGTYSTQQGYDITYIAGTLTITPQALTVAAQNQSKTYGVNASFGTTAFAVTGTLYGTDAITGVTLTSPGSSSASSVGSYAISVANATGQGVGNYTITYVGGTLAVTPAPLSITAQNQSKGYGLTASLGTTAFTVSGTLYGTDAISGVNLTSPGSSSASSVGSYAISVANAVGQGLENYTIAYVGGALSVTPAPLSITAQNQSKRYGTAVSLRTEAFATSGTLYNADAVWGATLSSPGSASTAMVGSYTISASNATGLGLSNYEITYVDGLLTVTPSPTSGQAILGAFVSKSIGAFTPTSSFACPSCSHEGISVIGGWNSPLESTLTKILPNSSLADVCGS